MTFLLLPLVLTLVFLLLCDTAEMANFLDTGLVYKVAAAQYDSLCLPARTALLQLYADVCAASPVRFRSRMGGNDFEEAVWSQLVVEAVVRSGGIEVETLDISHDYVGPLTLNWSDFRALRTQKECDKTVTQQLAAMKPGTLCRLPTGSTAWDFFSSTCAIQVSTSDIRDHERKRVQGNPEQLVSALTPWMQAHVDEKYECRLLEDGPAMFHDNKPCLYFFVYITIDKDPVDRKAEWLKKLATIKIVDVASVWPDAYDSRPPPKRRKL